MTVDFKISFLSFLPTPYRKGRFPVIVEGDATTRDEDGVSGFRVSGRAVGKKKENAIVAADKYNGIDIVWRGLTKLEAPKFGGKEICH